MSFQPNSDITVALQERIDALSDSGGGTIEVPAGLFHVKPIQLRSDITLVLAAGARLVASPRREDYFPIGYNHNEMGDVHSAFFAMDAANITIRGEGQIDLSGEAFYRMESPEALPSVGPEVTQVYLDEAPRRYDWRVNQPMFFHQCERIRIDGIRIVNAPCWTMSYNFCRDIKVTNLTIENSLIIPNNDGMHFTGSRDIMISGCLITAGDDCVALSSITDWSRPCENVVISNCVFKSASKAISVGYMHSIVRNVLIENVVVLQSNRAYVTMCHPGTGLVENVRVSNCILEGRSYGGNWWGNGEPIVIMATPHHIDWYRDPMPDRRFSTSVRCVSFSGVTCRGERPPAFVASEPITENIQMRGCIIEILPEEKPSLKGNVIDLAPGPANFDLSAGAGRVVCQHVDLVESGNVYLA